MATMACLRRLAAALGQAVNTSGINKAMNLGFGQKVKDVITSVWYHSLLSSPATHVVNMASTGLNMAWNIPVRALAAGISETRAMVGGRANSGVQAGESMAMAYGIFNSLGDAFRLSAKAYVQGEGNNLFVNPGLPSDTLGDVARDLGGQASQWAGSSTYATQAPNINPMSGKIGTSVESGISSRNLGFQKADINGHPVQQAMHLWNKAVDSLGLIASSVSSRAIMAEDEFASVIARSAHLRAYGYRTGVQAGLQGPALAAHIDSITRNPSPAMLSEAHDFARQITFTSPAGPVGRGLQQVTNTMWPLKMVLPFIRTPINLMKEAAANTPLGLLRRGLYEDLRKKGPEGDIALAKIALGTSAMAAMWNLANEGLVTGSGPTDPDLRAHWMTMNQEFSVKVGDTWYGYDRADPFGLFLGAAASYAEIAGQMNEMDAQEFVTAVAVATSKSILSKTWLRGPSNFLEAVMDPDRHGEKWVQRFMGTLLVPSGVAQVTRTTGIPGFIPSDPVWREVYSIMDAIKARTPGFSTELAPRRNMWGQKIHMEGALGPDIASPIYKFGQKDRPIDEWIYENKVPIRRPSENRGGVKMDPGEFDRFQELAGNAVKDPGTGLGLYDTMDALARGTHPTRQKTWDNATDGPQGVKAAILKSTVEAFRELAWNRLLQERPQLRARVRERAQEEARAKRETIMNPEAGVEATYAPQIGNN